MSQSNLKHLERIKEHIDKSNELSEEEKSNAWRHIEEWYAEDQAWGTFINKLAQISPRIEAILAELGLI
jgi:DNA phosphorothioation-dependent restriction protein DptG